MLKLCILAVMITTSAFSQTSEVEKKEDPGPTFPVVKTVENHEESRMHLGLNLGINSPEGKRGSTPELGVEIGFQPLIPFGLSLELSTSKFDGADDEMHKRTTLLAKGTYNFGGDAPIVRYSYLGLGTGPVFLNDGMEFGFAPLMGFDIPLYGETDHSCSVGFVAKYLFVTTNDPDSLITSAAVKYWF
jgi:hypothetical protein